ALGRDAHQVANLTKRDIAFSGSRAQTAVHGLLLQSAHVAAVLARGDSRAPLEGADLAGFHRERQRGAVATFACFAAHARAVRRHGRKVIAELEALAFLPARA